MTFEIVVNDIDMDEHEGHLFFSIGSYNLRAYYFAPNEFIDDYVKKHSKVKVDLWLVLSDITKICEKKRELTFKRNGPIIKGKVVSILSSRELTVDCGIMIDIETEKLIEYIDIGNYIQCDGSLQIYFLNSEWDRV